MKHGNMGITDLFPGANHECAERVAILSALEGEEGKTVEDDYGNIARHWLVGIGQGWRSVVAMLAGEHVNQSSSFYDDRLTYCQKSQKNR